MGTTADEDLAEYVSHEDFRAGLAQGRIRVIVDPRLARGYVTERLWMRPVMLALVGPGLALALAGHAWAGAVLVFLGVGLSRAVSWKAPAILLHLATRDASVYAFATQNGILEVRRS